MADIHGSHTGPAAGYEKRDANLRAVAWAGVGLTALCVGTFVFIAYIFHRYDAEIAAREKPLTTLTERDPVPEVARLLVDGPAELDRLHAYEEPLVHGYGWVQAQAGIARIPVERALELVAERGLPTWTPAVTNAAPAVEVAP